MSPCFSNLTVAHIHDQQGARGPRGPPRRGPSGCEERRFCSPKRWMISSWKGIQWSAPTGRLVTWAARFFWNGKSWGHKLNKKTQLETKENREIIIYGNLKAERMRNLLVVAHFLATPNNLTWSSCWVMALLSAIEVARTSYLGFYFNVCGGMSRIYTPELIPMNLIWDRVVTQRQWRCNVCVRERERERRKEPHWLWLNIIYMQIGCLTTKHCQICGFIDAPVASHSQVQLIPTT